MRLINKKILLAVGGSISAYKTPELVRLLKKNGADVQVMLSRSAKHFVSQLTLETLSGQPALTKMFGDIKGVNRSISHINSSRQADLILIAPATANMLAKFAFGMADDLISATVLGADCPVLIGPSMNVRMWKNFLVQDNFKRLKKAGYIFIDPEKGDLACGEVGEGRLADFNLILDSVCKVLTNQDLKGKKVLITAGPTREYLDPVRYLTNASSGKMALALIKEAYYRGAEVEVISSLSFSNLNPCIKVVYVTSAQEMMGAVMQKIGSADVFIANAAVADYGLNNPGKEKIKSVQLNLKINLNKNPDILKEVVNLKKKPFVVGFALETNDHLKNALKKFKNKSPDLLVLNTEKAIDNEKSSVTLIFSEDSKKAVILKEDFKSNIAIGIFDHIVKLI